MSATPVTPGSTGTAYVYGADRQVTVVGRVRRPRWAPLNHGPYVKVRTTEPRPREALIPECSVRQA
jgi:hypothetical protein